MVGQYLAGRLYPALGIPSLLLCVPPLIVQSRLGHLPSIVLVASVLGLNLQNVLNALIWSDWANNDWEGRIYCDIQIRFYSGLPVAIAGAVACIFKQLADAVRTDRVGSVATKSQRIWRWTFNLTLCILFPLIAMSTLYATSFARYSLTPILGCNLMVTPDWAAFALQLLWMRLNALIATGYCIVTIFRLIRHRRQVSGMIALSGMNKSRYVRLLVVSLSGLLFVLPMSLYLIMKMLLQRPVVVVFSWDQSHPPDWADSIYRLPWRYVEFRDLAPRWGQIVLGYPIFALLGLGREARLLYQAIVPRCMKKRSHTRQGFYSDNEQAARSLARPDNGGELTLASEVNPMRRMDDIERELWLVDNDGDLGGSRRNPGFGR